MIKLNKFHKNSLSYPPILIQKTRGTTPENKVLAPSSFIIRDKVSESPTYLTPLESFPSIILVFNTSNGVVKAAAMAPETHPNRAPSTAEEVPRYSNESFYI